MASKYFYRETIYNKYLGVSKEIKAQSSWELNMKVKEQYSKWDNQEKAKRQREAIQDLKDRANEMNEDADSKVKDIKNVLNDCINVNNKIDWDSLYNNKEFPEFIFNESEPKIISYFLKFKVPQKSFIEMLFKSFKIKREKLEQQATDAYNEALKNYKEQNDAAFLKWQEDKVKYNEEKEAYNKSISDWKDKYEKSDAESIERYFGQVLSNSKYPFEFDIENELEYNPITKILIVSSSLPGIDDITNIVGYKYVASSKSINPIEMKVKEFDEFYDTLIKQITLRALKEIFNSDYSNTVDSVVLNGWVKGIDKKTGQDFTSCIISINVSKEKFSSINLSRIDVQECIRDLRALVAGKLSMLAPVKPIMDLNKNDSRFIESRDVMAELNSIQNLAVMDWADFEHLVRELFSLYFSKGNSEAEVKVTQSSRDGGVDAIAFDPDPIKGGKFVIQAKRYNIVVPVSAVRDLYGTMINEGAAKGILVTTSYFGNDSREFVKDKPISLIDGSNLIHMFNEFGFNVKIELTH